ncbi:hypothetical protein [Mycobacterium leprae]|uniref:hypothetical protein n=1 Tax=Mycobacterium leprae TaxID=1769 RepID=UPI00030B4990|nr:hypothetical protein [Mycobacterium leprae]
MLVGDEFGGGSQVLRVLDTWGQDPGDLAKLSQANTMGWGEEARKVNNAISLCVR